MLQLIEIDNIVLYYSGIYKFNYIYYYICQPNNPNTSQPKMAVLGGQHRIKKRRILFSFFTFYFIGAFYINYIGKFFLKAFNYFNTITYIDI
jgi:hypothetical protein